MGRHISHYRVIAERAGREPIRFALFEDLSDACDYADRKSNRRAYQHSDVSVVCVETGETVYTIYALEEAS